MQNSMVWFTTFSLFSYYRHRKDMDMIFRGFLDIYPDHISKIEKGYSMDHLNKSMLVISSQRVDIKLYTFLPGLAL